LYSELNDDDDADDVNDVNGDRRTVCGTKKTERIYFRIIKGHQINLRLLNNLILDAPVACTTQVHHPADGYISRQQFRLKNHSRHNERSPIELSETQRHNDYLKVL